MCAQGTARFILLCPVLLWDAAKSRERWQKIEGISGLVLVSCPGTVASGPGRVWAGAVSSNKAATATEWE